MAQLKFPGYLGYNESNHTIFTEVNLVYDVQSNQSTHTIPSLRETGRFTASVDSLIDTSSVTLNLLNTHVFFQSSVDSDELWDMSIPKVDLFIIDRAKDISHNIEFPEIGIYQYITSNPYGIDDDKAIFIDGTTDKKLTFGQLKSNSKKLAAGLINKVGFKRGDVLAIISPNHIDYPVVVFGAIAAGGKVSMVNTNYNVILTDQLKGCGASIIVTHPDFLNDASEAATKANIHKSKIFLFNDKEHNEFQPFSSLFSDEEFDPVEFTPEEAKSITAYLCYSSGTREINKGVELSHFNIVSNIAQLEDFEDKISYKNTTFMGVLGATCVILPKFELGAFCRIIQDYKVDIAPIVPPMVLLLVKDPIVRKYNLSSLKLVISAAAPLSKELSNKFIETYGTYGTLIKQGYGSTETSPFTHWTKTEKNIVNGSIGKLIPNMECKIISDDNQELGYNETGEIYLRGPNIMKGYLNKRKDTDACIDSDGWFRTGDMGYVDPQGNFFIIDRVEELIKYKEHKIAPAKLEAILLTCPSIADAAVIGVYSDEQATEFPLAFVVLQPNEIKSDQMKEEIKKFVSQRVEQHERLRGGVYFTEKIPKTCSGKILRRFLVKNECILPGKKSVNTCELL
ncbi:hypothetical protein C1645_738947 [Glomus cerebriforme]|uniref:Acetyl-CoA synthetase-like protein n=1 Tax=Glomus cerebriforme TaxID=658196 RepID=A0A397SSA6_9GLOM|nr:hypothetical protein C1645_738947 [Glomus cerebriforme]